MRHLSDSDAKCYWKRYPDAADSMLRGGIPLTNAAADFSWNYAADNVSGFRKVKCADSDGTYHVELSIIEATCYW